VSRELSSSQWNVVNLHHSDLAHKCQLNVCAPLFCWLSAKDPAENLSSTGIAEADDEGSWVPEQPHGRLITRQECLHWTLSNSLLSYLGDWLL
jgi:hypothetical protein